MRMLGVAGLNYNKPIVPEMIDLWADALADVDSTLGMKAMGHHIKTNTWFPTIAHIRDLVRDLRPRPEWSYRPYRLPLPEGSKVLSKEEIEEELRRFRDSSWNKE